MRQRIGVLVVAMVSFAAVAACDGRPSESASSPRAPEAQWHDAFDGMPEFFVAVRPQAIKHDAIYGSLFKSVLRVAQAKSERMGVTVLEAAEGCDEILVGVHSDVDFVADGDATIVLRGVPANLDPERILDASGQPLFRPVREHSRVQELEREGSAVARRDMPGASIFVLPDRTWVLTMGIARQRARLAFEMPRGRPAPTIDPSALAVLRLDASTFLKRPRLQKSAAFGPLVRNLESMSIALLPGKGGVVVTLSYQDDDASTEASIHAARLVGELGREEASPDDKDSSRAAKLWAWLKDARVTRAPKTVRLHVAVPLPLLEELPRANPSDLAF